MSSIGFLNASRFLGRSLSSWATQSRSSLLCMPRSVPLGASVFVKRLNEAS